MEVESEICARKHGREFRISHSIYRELELDEEEELSAQNVLPDKPEFADPVVRTA